MKKIAIVLWVLVGVALSVAALGVWLDATMTDDERVDMMIRDLEDPE